MSNISYIVLDDKTLEVEDTKARTDIGDVSALETEAKNSLVEAVNECFQSASDGKALIASAITGKGIDTDSDATFQTMATNISAIQTNPTLQSKTATLSTSAQTIKADSGYDALSQVTVPAVVGTAGTSNVLTGRTFSSASGVNLTGTMADNGAVTSTLNAGASYTIPSGYHNGSGKVTANSLASQTAGTATASDIASGKTAYVNGSSITGTASNVYSATVTTTTNSTNTFITVDYRGSTTAASNSIASFTTTRSSYEQIICTYVSNSGTSSGSFSGANYNVKAIVVPNIGICFYMYITGDTYYSSFHTYGSVSPYYWVSDNGNGTYTHNITLALLASGSTATIKAY